MEKAKKCLKIRQKELFCPKSKTVPKLGQSFAGCAERKKLDKIPHSV